MAKDDSSNKLIDTKNNPASSVKKMVDDGNKMLYGTDPKMTDETASILANVRKSLAITRKAFSSNIGDNITDFFNSMEYEKINNVNSQNTKNAKNKSKNTKNLIDKNQAGIAANILSNETDRITGYENYETLVGYIPILDKALDAYTDSILSPDNITNSTTKFKYKDIDDDSQESKTVMTNLNALKDKYNLDERFHDIIRSANKYGDEFYAILSLDKEMNTILQESRNENYVFNKNRIYEPLTESEITDLEFLKEEIQDSQSKDKIDWQKEINDIINENIEFEIGSQVLAENSITLTESFNREISQPLFETTNYNDDGESKLKDINSILLNTGNSKNKTKNKKSPESIQINGSILKKLDRKKVIKIYEDGVTYGYYYIYNSSVTEADSLTSSETLSGIFNHNFKASGVPKSTTREKLKNKLIQDIFVKRIAKKIDKPFLANNQQFKNTIYNLLKLDYITKKKVKIVFLDTNEVAHFYPKLREDGYGESLLHNSMFLGMIYVSTLMTTLMMKLIRSPQKRVFYIEAGEDEEYEAVINDFVKNLKTMDMKIVGKDINTVLNSVGAFHDVFIPKVDGNAPIEFDTMDGLDANLTDDFLEYLEKTVVDSMDVPSSYIQSVSELEFSKEVSMQNAKFVRRISALQRNYTNGLSMICRILYKNEFLIGNKNSDKNKINNNIDIEKIFVDLPLPTSLLLSTIGDQIQSVKDIIEFATTIFMGENSEDTDLKNEFALNLAKEHFPAIDWDRMEELFKRSMTNARAKKLTAEFAEKGAGSEGMTDDSTGDDGSSGGGF